LLIVGVEEAASTEGLPWERAICFCGGLASSEGDIDISMDVVADIFFPNTR
jgi:hypothetical protein